MMAQPRKVREAAAAAEKLHKELYGPKAEKITDEDVALAAPPNLEVVGPKGENKTGEAGGILSHDENAPPANQQVPPAEPPETPPEPPREDTVDYWKQRALTKEGIDKKVAEENRQLRDDLNELRGAMATLTQIQGQAQPTPPPTEPEVPAQAQARSLLKPEEIADYGADLIDVMKRAAREAVQGEINKVKQENKQLREELGSFQQGMAQKARDDIYGTLLSEVPNWQEINTDKDFLQWLEERDLFSGQPRGALLQEAFEHNDAARVVAFFKGFLRERKTVEPDQTAPPQAQPSAQPAQTLDTMVAPGKPRGGAASSQGDQKRMWSQAQIHAFYQEVHHGKYRGKEKEQRAIEQDIIAATKEGRVSF
jgi:hypothetical protein